MDLCLPPKKQLNYAHPAHAKAGPNINCMFVHDLLHGVYRVGLSIEFKHSFGGRAKWRVRLQTGVQCSHCTSLCPGFESH